MKRATLGVCVPAILLAAIQFIPVRETNPEVLDDLNAPPTVAATLRRSCYDCHSNETRWRWYGRVAPMSWVIASHVNRGREQLNFSEWQTYYPQTQRRKLQWLGRAIETGQMPPRSYLLFHPEARMTATDRESLEQWLEARLKALSGEVPAK